VKRLFGHANTDRVYGFVSRLCDIVVPELSVKWKGSTFSIGCVQQRSEACSAVQANGFDNEFIVPQVNNMTPLPAVTQAIVPHSTPFGVPGQTFRKPCMTGMAAYRAVSLQRPASTNQRPRPVPSATVRHPSSQRSANCA